MKNAPQITQPKPRCGGYRGLSAFLLALVLAPILALTSSSAAPLVAQKIQPLDLQPQAVAQIQALLAEKVSRNAAQRKVGSRLLREIDRRQGGLLSTQVPTLRPGVELEADGRVRVDVDAAVGDRLLARIEALGGTVLFSSERFASIRADLPLTALEPLAREGAVRSIRPADVAMTQMVNTTEGDVAHGADLARANLGIDGSGIKVGAMSDSVDALAAVQASGDLPPGVTVLPGQSGNPGTSEGTALLEILHDMAPGAELFFATGIGGQAQMAQNILDLAAAGCQVIVDDVLYLTEPVFQDGIIAQAVDAVAAQGVLYYSSAGNSGNLAAGTSGVWEGDYVGTTLPAPLVGNGLSALDFGGGSNSNELAFDSPSLITLQWSDPFGAAVNDYDLFLLDPTLTTVLDASTNVQNGTQDPVEALNSTGRDDTGNRIVAVLFNGAGRFMHLNTHRGRLDLATHGQIFGHPAAQGAMAVGAVNVATAGGGVFQGGAANPPEPFSSDGPRRIFFEPDGSPVVVERAAPLGQPSEVRQKPDIAAADGVSTATPGFNPFFGTSAAAPHAAGIGALIKEFIQGLNNQGGQTRIVKQARDVGAPGRDNVAGEGIPRADKSIPGNIGFGGDVFDFQALLGAFINGSFECFGPHQSGMMDNDVLFDGLQELLDTYLDGTQPSISEFETDPDQETTDINAEIGLENGDDLFPDGFEDPATGTPLDAACVEIGIDDTLDSDTPSEVTSATVEFFSNGSSVGGPFDFTSLLQSPFDGRISVVFPGFVGLDIDDIKLNIQVDPLENQQALFADGFESGDAASWTDRVP